MSLTALDLAPMGWYAYCYSTYYAAKPTHVLCQAHWRDVCYSTVRANVLI